MIYVGFRVFSACFFAKFGGCFLSLFIVENLEFIEVVFVKFPILQILEFILHCFYSFFKVKVHNEGR